MFGLMDTRELCGIERGGVPGEINSQEMGRLVAGWPGVTCVGRYEECSEPNEDAGGKA